jgi:transposase
MRFLLRALPLSGTREAGAHSEGGRLDAAIGPPEPLAATRFLVASQAETVCDASTPGWYSIARLAGNYSQCPIAAPRSAAGDAYVDETGAPTGNADDRNPEGKRGRQWVMVTAVVTVFIQGLSRSTAAASELLGSTFGGIVVSDRFSAYNHLPTQQRQLCWAHLIRDLTAIAERPGASAEFGGELLSLQRQLFGHWHRYNKNGPIDWPGLQQRCRPIRQAFEATLQRVVELSCQRSERDRTPWASMVRTCQQLLKVADGLWTFVMIEGNRAHQQRRCAGAAPVGDSTQDQSRRPIGQWCRLPDPPAHGHNHPQQQGRDVGQFLEQAWIAHHRGGATPSLLQDP